MYTITLEYHQKSVVWRTGFHEIHLCEVFELTDPEEDHHAEHGQQRGDHHAEEHGQFLRLPLRRPLPGASRVLSHGLSGRRGPKLGIIDAGGEAVMEKRSPLCHDESWRFATSESAQRSFRIGFHARFTLEEAPKPEMRKCFFGSYRRLFLIFT